MKTFFKVLLTVIIMGAIGIGGYMGYDYMMQQKNAKFEEERVARVEEVTTVTEDLKSEITDISQLSVEEIQTFIEENAVVDEAKDETKIVLTKTEDLLTDNSLEDIAALVEDIEYYDPWSGETITGDDIVEFLGETVMDAVESEIGSSLIDLAEDLYDEYIDGDGESSDNDKAASDNKSDKDKKDKSDKDQDKEDKSNKDTKYKDKVDDNPDDESEDANDEESDDWKSGSSKDNVNRVAILGKDAVKGLSDEEKKEVKERASKDHNLGESVGGESLTLEDRQAIRTSDEETALWIEADEEVINSSEIDFSDKKITCLGDSVTEAANLLEEPDYQQYTYPTKLQEILGCEEMTNLGIGGSSFGRYWYEPFCDRYKEIPEDSDIIIIFGGYNDGYCLHEDMVGDIEKCEPNTLYGDINDLMVGLKKDYPDAEIIFMTPMPNLLHDVLRKERPELLPQTVVVNAILELAEKNEITVIDNYNANFLDSHDADIVADYLPDSVHPNPEGYEVLAKHVAAELIRIEENKESEDEDLDEASKEDEDSKDDDKDKKSDDTSDDEENEDAKETPSPKKNILKKIFSRDDDDKAEENSDEASDDEASDDEGSMKDKKATASPSSKPSDDKNSKNNKDEDTKSDSGEENASPKPSPGEKKVVIKRD